jgi:mono/diheme cytochrome c family protein
MLRVVAGAIALLYAVEAGAQEDVPLKDAAGREIVEVHCNACHSLDYPRQNRDSLAVRLGRPRSTNDQDFRCADRY